MKNQKPALGRGLDALLGADGQLRSREDARALAGGIFDLPIGLIQPNPFQPRQEFSPEALHSLAKSIEQLGIIQPVTVRATKGDAFELISGERRLKAAKLAGLEKIPAYIRPAKDVRILEMALVENVQREDLNPIEVAQGYQRLIEEYNLTQEDVSHRVGKSRPQITNFLRLLHLPSNIQVGIRKRIITPGHARALLALSDDQSKNQLFSEIQREGLSVREVEQRVKNLSKQPKKQKKHPKTDPKVYIIQAENKLRRHLGSKVEIKNTKSGTGQVVIHYYSEEDLTRILDLISHSG